jgi:glutamate/aspartate transport system permease protein
MHWDWQVFCTSTVSGEATACFGATGDITYLQWMISAWGWTASVAALGLVIALATGVLVGIARTLPTAPLVWLATAWTELFRNIPLLVQVFLWYHVLPVFIPALGGLSSFWLAAIALGLFTSARIAEQVRAGLQSLPAGQRLAATALGLSSTQVYVKVLLPQALRIILPALTSEAMNVVKNSSVAFAVSVTELTLFAMQAQEETGRGLEIYAGVTLLYAFTALSVNRVMAWIESRTRLPGRLGAHG